jgi:hypothetical protein
MGGGVGKGEEMATELLKCPKCGAVMVSEGYHEYAWYLDGQRVEGCPSEPEAGRVRQEKFRSILAAMEEREALSGQKP